jgi:RNA polymerase sigma-70 factor (ECF subfamily)
MSRPLCALLGGQLAVAASDELETALASALARARAAWPTVTVTDELFVAHLARVLDGDRLLAQLRRDTIGDLYVACACARGDSEALQRFEQHHMSWVAGALRGVDLPPAVLEEAQQQVRQLVLVAHSERRPAIADYNGSGDLRGWLRVIVLREAFRLAGRHRDAPLPDNLDEVSPNSDPELDLLKERYRGEFRHAFRDAFAALSARERNLLRQHHLQGLTVDKLGALYHVHRATAARWVAAAAEHLLDETRRALMARLDIDGSETDSILRLIRSRLDASIRQHLDTDG